MPMHSMPTRAALVAVLAGLALAGCGRKVETSARAATPPAPVASAMPAGDVAAKAARDATEATQRAADQAREASKNAADQASNKVADALITTSVNAELAKDPKLSAVQIDVDTDNGRVALHGTAPDAAARQRASELAAGVQGVVSVDNHLVVEAGRS